MVVKKALMQIKMQIVTVAANFLPAGTMDLKSSTIQRAPIEEKQTDTIQKSRIKFGRIVNT